MKKLILLFTLLLSVTIYSQSLILTEDTVIDHDENYTTVRTNGFDLHVNGSLATTSFILLNGGGTITATDDIIVGSNIFFLEDNGTVKSETGIAVGNDIAGLGTIVYCTFLNAPIIGDDVDVVQDCSLSVPEIRDFIKSVTIGEPYVVENLLGQIIRTGTFKSRSDIFSNEINTIYFPRLNYRARMILKPKN